MCVLQQGAVQLVRLIECMLVVYGSDGAEVVAAAVPLLIRACTKAAFVGGGGSGGGADSECEPDVVLCGYLTVLARLAFDHPPAFAAALNNSSAASSAAASTGQSPHPAQSALQILMVLVELWLGKFDSVGYKSGSWGNRRKAWALALCSVMPHVMCGGVGGVGGSGVDAAAAGWMLEKVEEVLEVCAAVVSDLAEEAGAAGGMMSPAAMMRRNMHSANASSGEALVCGAERKKAVLASDRVGVCDLRAHLHRQLQACQAAVGEQPLAQAIARAEGSTRQDLGL
jgi:hypothetical protein